jgi:Beta-lactamase superfamily domain
MIPVGAYEPRWFMKTMHVNTDEAVQAHADLRARYSVGMHWGTFRLTDERLDEPPLMLAQSLARAGVPDTEFFLMGHGETRLLEDTLMDDTAHDTRPGVSRLLKNVASGLQPGAPGAQEPECTEGDHEDSGQRASPDQGRAVVFQQPVREK